MFRCSHRVTHACEKHDAHFKDLRIHSFLQHLVFVFYYMAVTKRGKQIQLGKCIFWKLLIRLKEPEYDIWGHIKLTRT